MVKTMLDNVSHVHFIGIGGISMSGLAEILLKDGYRVSGSDWQASGITQALAEKGVPIFLGNDAAHIKDGVQLVVHTAAVKPHNPELVAARQRGIPIIDRAQLLGFIMKGYARSVAVAGTHGKTSTTAILADVFLSAGLDPTISIGGVMDSIGGRNIRVGHSPYFLLEACEYFDSFLQFHPAVGVILNMESDHLDYFGTFENMKNSFRQFAGNAREALVVHGGIPGLRALTEGATVPVLTYGPPGSQFTARHLETGPGGLPTFHIYNGEVSLGVCRLPLVGTHNIDNALAAAAVATAMGLPPADIIRGLEGAQGVHRRYQAKGYFAVNGHEIPVIDDYAHHPTEIKTTLAAAKRPGSRILCAFQSHTYTRTQHLMDTFAAAFEDADEVLILPIFAARETLQAGQAPNYLAELLTKRIRENGQSAHFLPSFETAAAWLRTHAQPGDVLLTMGAGDIHLLGEGLVAGE